MTNPEPSPLVLAHEALELPITDIDPLICAAHALERLSLKSFSLGVEVETRYLGREVLAIDEHGLTELMSSRATVHESGFYDAADRLIDYDFLKGLVEGSAREYREWPRRIVERAQSHGIFVQEESRDAISTSRDRWHIDPGTKNDPSPHLTSWHTDEDRTYKRIVRLDDVHSEDPEFLQQQLRDLHANATFARIAQMLLHNREIHETPTERVVPEFMQEIMRLPLDKRQSAMRDILALIRQITPLDSHTPSRAYAMAADLIDSPALTRFSHLFSCPTQPDNVKDNNESLFHFSQEIYRTVMEQNSKEGGSSHGGIEDFLEEPYNLLPDHLDSVEAELTEQYKAGQTLATFIEAGLEADGPEEILALLMEKMFSTSVQYAEIREALDKPITASNHLDEAILWAAKRMNQAPEAVSRQVAVDMITRGFTDYRSALGRVDAIRFGRDGQVYVDSGAIQATLVLLACSTAKKLSLEATGKTSEFAELLEADVLENHMKSLEITRQQVNESNKIRTTARDFKQRHNLTDEDITREDIDWLSPLFVGEDGRWDESLFTTVFHGFLLEKQGIINLRQPSMIAFIRDFLRDGGELSPERAQKLNRLFA